MIHLDSSACLKMWLSFRGPSVALSLAILFTFYVTLKSHGIFKITNVKCLMLDKDYAHFEYCRLKAIRRNVAAFSVKLVLHEGVRDCWVHVEWLRRYSGYRPFLVNQSFDACKFIKERKAVGLPWVLYSIFGHFTNLNHSCPYNGSIIMENFYPDYEHLVLPVPTGDYLLKTQWRMKNKVRLSVDVWVAYQDPHDIGKSSSL